eukprot:TRINITY_DN1047_c0_g1_i4.p1 TRINITY_DN1047_c0_g1~~TRINITY_DN1047_c0_g1_i4.p1  ORF type:complete len:337 (+),score=66.03 TRINITY_DN1047_c0_g1_i4:5-1015(+)
MLSTIQTPNNKPITIENLPFEIFLQVIRFLNFDDVLSFFNISKTLNKIGSENETWKHITNIFYPHLLELHEETQSWRDFCQDIYRRKSRSDLQPLPHNTDCGEDSPQSSDHVFKIGIFGSSSGEGRSSLMTRYLNNEFSDHPQPSTSSVYYRVPNKVFNGWTCDIQFWDIFGNFMTRNTGKYKGLTGAIFVFDVTDPPALTTLRKWLDVLWEAEHLHVLFVGNKADLLPPSEVTCQMEKMEAMLFAAGQDYRCESMSFASASAKTGENVEMIFESLAQRMLAQCVSVMNKSSRSSSVPSNKVKRSGKDGKDHTLQIPRMHRRHSFSPLSAQYTWKR